MPGLLRSLGPRSISSGSTNSTLPGNWRMIATRVRAHLDAGADHVAIQSFGPMPTADVWHELAPELLG